MASFGLTPTKLMHFEISPYRFFFLLSTEIYWTYKTPYFIFVRDTLSYLVLLGLHLGICLEPSQLPFSGLEWAILVFFLGRLLTEKKQVSEAEHSERERARTGKLETIRNYINRRYIALLISDLCSTQNSSLEEELFLSILF